MKTIALIAALLAAAPTLAAADFAPLSDKSRFLELVEGRMLTNRIFGVKLTVASNGTIAGAAAGWDISGTWSWENGFFCREMEWGGDPIPYNCQLVELRGSDELRFTVDQGRGRSAQFRLR